MYTNASASSYPLLYDRNGGVLDIVIPVIDYNNKRFIRYHHTLRHRQADNITYDVIMLP